MFFWNWSCRLWLVVLCSWLYSLNYCPVLSCHVTHAESPKSQRTVAVSVGIKQTMRVQLLESLTYSSEYRLAVRTNQRHSDSQYQNKTSFIHAWISQCVSGFLKNIYMLLIFMSLIIHFITLCSFLCSSLKDFCNWVRGEESLVLHHIYWAPVGHMAGYVFR